MDAEPNAGAQPAASFATWYAAEHPKVLGALRVLSGNRDAAADATDEAFVRALARWSRVGRMESPAAWTFQVALNALRRDVRRRGVAKTRHEELARDGVRNSQHGVSGLPDPELWMIVDALPERQRMAIVLRYVADLPEADIAAVMGIRRGTVAATLAQARARLGVMLRADEFETTEVHDG